MKEKHTSKFKVHCTDKNNDTVLKLQTCAGLVVLTSNLLLGRLRQQDGDWKANLFFTEAKLRKNCGRGRKSKLPGLLGVWGHGG